MNEIEHYWQEFSAIQDGLYRDLDDFANLRSARTAIANLVELVNNDISEMPSVIRQLSYWSGTFYRLIGEISCDLNEHTDAIAAFERSLDADYCIETAILLIKSLIATGNVEKAITRIQELHEQDVSFLESNDVESAAKLLTVIGSHPRIAESVNTSLLRDILATIATRGIDKVSLKPLRTP